MIVLIEIIIADITSLRSRLLFSYVPAIPFLVSCLHQMSLSPITDRLQINTWVSGDVTAAVLTTTTWRWGVGMWAIIYTACSIPLIAALMWSSYKAKKAGALDDCKTPYQIYGPKRLASALFWQLDVPGIILLIAVFGCILTVSPLPHYHITSQPQLTTPSHSPLQAASPLNGPQPRSSRL